MKIESEQLALSFAISEVNNYLHFLQEQYDNMNINIDNKQIDANHKAYTNYVNDVRQRHCKKPIVKTNIEGNKR